MKLKHLLIATAVLSLLIAPLLTIAHDETECEAASLFNTWARSSPDGAPNGAIFGLLTNLSNEADTLLSASTTAAEAVELHETVIGEGDVMQMRPVEGGIIVPPRSYQELQPGALHIMLINLTQPLVAGETIELTLNFERMGEFSVLVPIVDMALTEDTAGDSPMMQPEATPLATTSDAEWSPECARMHVLGAWSRPAGAGMPNSAAYALLVNLTDETDTLVSAESAVASVVELHEMKMADGDVMQMRPVEGGISVPAGGAVLLQPGGLHVMLINLQQALEVDTTMELTLNFANAETITLEVPVQEPVVEEMPMNAGGM